MGTRLLAFQSMTEVMTKRRGDSKLPLGDATKVS